MTLKVSFALGLSITLISAASHAFPELRPVPMTADGVYAFQSAMPEPSVIERGSHRALSEGCPEGCYVPSVQASEALVVYLEGLFDYYGYDYGATVYDYTRAMVGPNRLTDTDLGMAVQYTRLEEFVNVAVGLLQAGEGLRLEQMGVLSSEETHELRILLEPGYFESLGKN